MKKKPYYLLLFFLSWCAPGFAQSVQEKQVFSATSALTKAMLKPEKQSLEKLMADDLSYGHSAGLIQNKTEIIDGLINGPFRFLTIDVPSQTIKVIKNIAIVRQVLLADYAEKEAKGKLKFGIMLIWQLEKGQWKLLARQAIKL